MSVLEGVRVLDLSRVMSGPYCTAMLADLGAEVIKLETPGSGDDSRHFGPFVNGASVYFALLNRGKKSVALNLKNAKAREIAQRLAGGCDVVVENFRPGVAARLGLDYTTLAGLPQHLGIRPKRPLRRPAGVRPDRAGDVGAHVDHGPAAGPAYRGRRIAR